MSDREMPERGSLPGPGGNRFDAVDRLRKKLEGMKAAAAGAPEPGDDAESKLTRLPRRPRRTTEEVSERPHKTWRSEGPVYDSPPTRPALRSELERETGWWPVDPGRHPAPQDDPGRAEQDASVIDLAASRRKRAGDDTPGTRRMARPRRIGPSAGEGSSGDQDGDPHGNQS